VTGLRRHTCNPALELKPAYVLTVVDPGETITLLLLLAGRRNRSRDDIADDLTDDPGTPARPGQTLGNTSGSRRHCGRDDLFADHHRFSSSLVRQRCTLPAEPYQPKIGRKPVRSFSARRVASALRLASWVLVNGYSPPGGSAAYCGLRNQGMRWFTRGFGRAKGFTHDAVVRCGLLNFVRRSRLRLFSIPPSPRLDRPRLVCCHLNTENLARMPTDAFQYSRCHRHILWWRLFHLLLCPAASWILHSAVKTLSMTGSSGTLEVELGNGTHSWNPMNTGLGSSQGRVAFSSRDRLSSLYSVAIA